MKKCLGIFIFALAALTMSSCSENFDIAAPYKDITVVYGILNVGEPVQYIRVQKAFLDPNRSALDVAKNPDSNYYRNITVRMKGLDPLTNSMVTDFELQKVDLDTLGSPKLPGVFFSSPNLAYRYTQKIDPSLIYRLLITNNETGNVDSADTKVIDTTRISEPSPTTHFVVQELNRTVYVLDFSTNNKNVKYSLNITPSVNAALYQGYIKFNYVNVENGVQKDTFFVWNFASYVPPTTPTQLTTTTDQFYNLFISNIPKARTGQERFLDSADVYVWAADRNYYNYMINSQVQGGLTADQIKPNYTTIRGKDVLGMFGSRAKRIRYNVAVNSETLDSLMKNRFTIDLNFKGRSDH